MNDLCHKSGFASKKEAKLAKKKKRREDGKPLLIYLCQLCRKYHIGVKVTMGGRNNEGREFGIRN